jgi:hypothetical protein
MARQKTTPPEIIDVQIKQDALDHDRSAANQLALVQQEIATRVRAVAQQMGYQLPVESCDPDLIQRDIAVNMRRSVEACLEVGRGLRVLKEACGHGNFIARLEVLGIDHSVAKRFMQAATKFSNSATSRLLTAAGSQSKLLEMLVLDDEQIEELELTGETGELSLDDVATMSVKELRAALRKERGASAKARTELERQEAVNAELHAESRRIKRQKPDEAQAALHTEAAEITNSLLGLARGEFRDALRTLAEADDNTHLMAGMVGQVQAVLLALRDEFSLPDVVGDGTPEWQRWAAATGASVPDAPAAKAAKKTAAH